MPTATAAPSLLPHAETLTEARRRLFEAAIALFGARGYHAVSVRDLANELGMAPGALYAHVGSKEELLYQLVAAGLEEHRSRVRAAVLDAGPEPADQLRALIRAHVQLHLEFPDLARVISRELRSLTEERYDAAVLVRNDTERTFLDVVERGVRLGSFATAEPRLAMLAIAGMGIRAAEWWTPEDPLPADAVVETFADYAVRLLEAS